MDIIKPRILSGFLELLPKDQVVFDAIKNGIKEVFESNGFLPIDTPVMELSEVLLAKAGGETEKQIYSLTKGENDLCLRFDLTVPLARYVAMHHGELAFPFKRYHISKVYRGERPQKGRYREFYQCDIDIIGEEELSVLYDAECANMIYQIFELLQIEDFVIHINNRKLLNGFVESIGEKENCQEILRIIDKYEKIGREKVILCLEDIKITKDKTDKIMSFIEIAGDPEYVIGTLESMNVNNKLFEAGVKELSDVHKALKAMEISNDHYMLDIKTVRGLDYYTGTVFETMIESHKEFGSVCSGGRYDNLASHYTNKKLPGVGVSVGLSRLFELLRDNNLLKFKYKSVTSVAVIPLNDEYIFDAINIGSAIREAGISTEVYYFNRSFKAKLNYANKAEVPYVVLVGEDEVKSNKVTLKDMNTGVQKNINFEEMIEELIYALYYANGCGCEGDCEHECGCEDLNHCDENCNCGCQEGEPCMCGNSCDCECGESEECDYSLKDKK